MNRGDRKMNFDTEFIERRQLRQKKVILNTGIVKIVTDIM